MRWFAFSITTLAFIGGILAESVPHDKLWATRPWICNDVCLASLLPDPPPSTGCLNWIIWPEIARSPSMPLSGVYCTLIPEIGPHYYCPKRRNETLTLSTCGKPKVDFRFACVPEGEPLIWYTGWQSVTLSGKTCLTWQNIDWAVDKFSEFFAALGGIEEQGNACRNPDSWSGGPWCYTHAGEALRREPCFLRCRDALLAGGDSFAIESERGLCLSRVFISKLPTLLDSGVPVDLLLADIPAPRLPLVAMPFLTPPMTSTTSRIAFTPRCVAYGPRTRIFGPWTLAVMTPLDREYRLVAKSLPDETNLETDPWDRCYAACEDDFLTCLPSPQSYNYFGSRDISLDGRQCAMPSDVSNWLHRLIKVQKVNVDEEKNDLGTFYRLFFDPIIGEKKNPFAEAFVRRLASASCFNYGKMFSKFAESPPNDVIATIGGTGVGCFVVTFDDPANATRLVNITYEPCLRTCEGHVAPPVLHAATPTQNAEKEAEEKASDLSREQKSTEFEALLESGPIAPAVILIVSTTLSIVGAAIVCGLNALEKL